MPSTAALAFQRNDHLVRIADGARSKALTAWRGMRFRDLDGSWMDVGPQVVAAVTSAQMTAAKGSDRFTAQVANQDSGGLANQSAIIPEALVGIDGQGRDVGDTMYGAVAATKKAIGAGFGETRSMEVGAVYLAAMLKTVVADVSRAADLTSSAGRGFTYYVRVCNGAACSRCAILAGIRSAKDAFLRHVSCQCSAVPVWSEGKPKAPAGMYSSPSEYFDSLTAAQQDRVFTKAGADAIREGSDIPQVVSARRGANGIGYATGRKSAETGFRTVTTHGRLQKTTIGVRPNGEPVQVYATTEGTTVRGRFGRGERGRSGTHILPNDRYSKTERVRLMPEEIMKISGDDKALRQAFLRDAGYLDYGPFVGYSGDWISREAALKAADRRMVDQATLRYGNFTLG